MEKGGDTMKSAHALSFSLTALLVLSFLLIACSKAPAPPEKLGQDQTGGQTAGPQAPSPTPDALNSDITSANEITDDLDDSEVSAEVSAAQKGLDDW